MLACVTTAAVLGLEGRLVEVQVDIAHLAAAAHRLVADVWSVPLARAKGWLMGLFSEVIIDGYSGPVEFVLREASQS
jgi:hypothetical protein